MKKTFISAAAFVLAVLMAACSSKTAVPSSSSSVPEGMTQRYVKGVAYQIPDTWKTHTTSTGYMHFSEDGGFMYVFANDYSPAQLKTEAASYEAIDTSAKWMYEMLDNFDETAVEDSTFNGHYSREYDFFFDYTFSGKDESTKMRGHALIFAKLNMVYIFMFNTIDGIDSGVITSQQQVLDSIT